MCMCVCEEEVCEEEEKELLLHALENRGRVCCLVPEKNVRKVAVETYSSIHPHIRDICHVCHMKAIT